MAQAPIIWYGTYAKLLASGGLLDYSGNPIGGGGNSFSIIQPDLGTSPTAASSTDVLSLTSSDGSVALTGNSGSKSVDFSVRRFANLSAGVSLYEDFLTSWGSSLWGTNNWVSSNVAQITLTGQNPGVVSLTTGATTTGSGFLVASNNSSGFFQVGLGKLTAEFIVAVPVLSNGTDTFSVTVGLGQSSVTDSPANAIRWRYSSTLNSGNWTFSTSSGGSSTSVDSGVAATTGFVRLGFIVNAAGTSIQAYINGVAKGAPITTNIPSTVMQPFNYILKSAGTTSCALYLDAISYYLAFTTPR